MDDVDPLDSDEFDAATPAQRGSSATGSPLGFVDGMGSAVENALDVDAIVADAAMTVVTQLVNNLAKEALSAALTPERLELLQETRGLSRRARIRARSRRRGHDGRRDGLLIGG